jgi:two-component system phosphate regulon sensor histidine kinase PhoR
LKDITRSKEVLEVQKNFITNVGHELKTPLTSIMGYIIAIKEESDITKIHKFMETIERNAHKLNNILMDFLNLSKIESSRVLNLSLVPIGKIPEEIHKNLESKIESKNAKITYNFELSDNLMKIDLDKVILILKNLIENAIIYNKNTPEILVGVKEQFDRYVISVKDNGIGINESDTFKIFDRFYRVDKARTSNVAGTGLGLSIVNELVHICGGEIQVSSSEKGTTFLFTLIK